MGWPRYTLVHLSMRGVSVVDAMGRGSCACFLPAGHANPDRCRSTDSVPWSSVVRCNVLDTDRKLLPPCFRTGMVARLPDSAPADSTVFSGVASLRFTDTTAIDDGMFRVCHLANVRQTPMPRCISVQIQFINVSCVQTTATASLRSQPTSYFSPPRTSTNRWIDTSKLQNGGAPSNA